MATILLVDNDPLQALQRKSILERRFSDVQRVNDAAEALCLVERPQFARNLGLVVSGEHMRGIGGPAFVAELHTRLPKVPVLVLGGGSKGTNDEEGRCDEEGRWLRFLPTPFTNEEILAAASRLLAMHELETA
jgi:DNA-binding NtrC family response regulator